MREEMAERELILLVDDEADLLENCVRILEEEDLRCVTTTDSTKAFALVEEHRPSVVITDFLMPGKNGMEVLKEIQAKFPDIPVIMFSAFATINGVVDAVKSGAFDYLTKPFSSDQLVIAAKRAIDQSRLQRENLDLKEKLKSEYFNHQFVGKHPRFLKTVELIEKVATTESNALIFGETGTGKELAARAIHLHSKRAEAPFVIVDCSTANDEMFEAVKADRLPGSAGGVKNVFDEASAGTIYLENVDELDPAMQSKLVRLLQDRKAPLGNDISGDKKGARLIASTTSDLAKRVSENRFRENLYYFLNVVKVELPPLRERKEDIGMLCDHFFREIANGRNSQVSTLHPDALSKLMEYGWPGNVRELQNVIEHAVSFSEGRTVTVKSLPEEVRSSVSNHSLPLKEARKKWLMQFEKYYLENLLLSNKGNISRASEKAGIARMSLYRMLKRTGLHDLVMSERSIEKENNQNNNKNTG
jgi:DNA-binding NtrC family response regulator